MPDYSLGKIYMIYPKVDGADEGDVYYGSTTVTLARRMAKHRDKDCRSKILFDKYGIENCFIELVQEYPCETKDELTKKEGEYIRANKCVNKVIPGRTQKEYRVDNLDKLKENQKQHYIENRDKLLENQKQYYIENHNKRLEYIKQYRIDNRDKINELQRQKATCPHCNKELIKHYLPTHIKSGYCRSLPRSIHITDPESN